MRSLLTLEPRTYILVDRVTKLLGVVGLTVALVNAAGPYSIPIGLLAVLSGVATVFIAPAEE